MADVASILDLALARAAKWPLKHRGFSTFLAGLRACYKEGRKGFHSAFSPPKIERLHAWRMQVKYLWNQINLLQPVWPRVLGGLAKELKALADDLSDHHDLTILRESIVKAAATLNETEVARLLSLIDSWCAELEAGAAALGRRIYAEEHRQFGYRIRHYWKAWKAEPPLSVQIRSGALA
jgi:CHAD domain-containing protein